LVANYVFFILMFLDRRLHRLLQVVRCYFDFSVLLLYISYLLID